MEITYKLGDFPDPGDRDLYNGIQEINNNNYQKALEYFEKSSKYDNEYGSLFTAIFYFAGFGLAERDPPKALKLLKMVASTWNNRVAQYLIGVMYYGRDTDESTDRETGFQWLILAANNGWYDAMTFAAIHYYQAKYVGDKLKPAVAWLEKVASHDVTDDELIDNGTLYLFGNKDFELSMVHVKPEVMSILNAGDKHRLISPAKNMQIERATRAPNFKEYRVVLLWNLLTNKKSSSVSTAQLFLLRIYYSEERLLKDIDKAFYWAKKSANNNEEESYIWLGIFYLDGKNIEPDYKEAAKWFEKAYNSGKVSPASHFLGLLYQSGKGVQKNCSIALRLFKESLIHDDKYRLTYYSMGSIYENGDDGVPQDYQKAYECFLKAYELGHADGATELGIMYCNGMGVEKNVGQAFSWISRAVAMGSPLAELIFKQCMS